MIVGNDCGFRKNSEVSENKLTFIFNTGGLGDFVNYSAATNFMARNYPWINGKVYAPKYLVELLQDIHKDTNFEIKASENFEFIRDERLIGPDLVIDGINRSPQFYTPVCAHPLDVGFAWYAGMTTPKGATLPVLNYDRPIEMPERYVVFPVGNVHDARLVSGKELNPIIDHVVKLNIVPIFLGKTDLLCNGVKTTTFPTDIDYQKGIDLRDKTTIKEAAAIMQHASCVVGLDTGLLHLAALMFNSKIIFGYNITSIEHRKPRRNHGKTINLSISQDELSCAGCQSNMRHVKHEFDRCYYGDKRCIELLFKNDGLIWRQAINQMLGV